jgi:NADH-quinone oxidoreductase subunit G
MAAAAQTTTVTITLNGIELAVPKNELVVEAAKRLGVEIPIFCYHDRMKPVGMCRMCLVEVGTKAPDGTVRMMPKPQAACTLPCSDGLIVNTDTDKIHTDRRSVLEMLLINHPLDCPICDRGGECPLQNNTLFYGPSTSRYIEVKRHAVKAYPLSKHVVLDLERCIQCGRCVRFTEEISGDAQLAFRFRGAKMQPSTFELTDFDSKFSGNVIEICPVGALTSAQYRFRARPWDLETKPAVCTNCSNGCNVWMDHRIGKIVRINGRVNESINEEWTCDKGKFGHDFYNGSDRVSRVLIRRGDSLNEADWSEAFGALAAPFKEAGASCAVLAGSENSNEDLFALKQLFTDVIGSPNLDYRTTADLSARPAKRCATSLVDIEHRPTILVFGTSLADELPIVYLRVRKAAIRHGAKVVVASTTKTDVDGFAHAAIHYESGQEGDVVAALGGDAKAQKALGIAAATAEAIKGCAVVATESIYNLPGGAKLVEELAKLGDLNVFALGANDQGAHEVGFLPQSGGHDARAILDGCTSGSIKALWLAGYDPIAAYGELGRKALEKVDFLVVSGHTSGETQGYASIVLPQCGPAEAEGSWTNCEGHVQRMDAILVPPGNAKPGWKISSELSMRLKPAPPVFHASEVMQKLAGSVQAFAGATYDQLPEEGHVLHQQPYVEEVGLER